MLWNQLEAIPSTLAKPTQPPGKQCVEARALATQSNSLVQWAISPWTYSHSCRLEIVHTYAGST